MKRGLLMLPVLAFATHAAAQEQPTYVVKEGDTCDGIAKKIYGDAKRYDLLHEANPELGPMPHKLKAGTVLRTPKPGAAAKLTFIRKDVEASTPMPHVGQVNEDLDRGHKVGTLADSSAEVTFKDTSRLQLSEHTLVVILGGSSTMASAKQATASDTTLMKGELYAHLGALAGKKPVATPSANVEVGGASKISVDAKSTTRLAVYKGQSSLAASGAKVDVSAGFGSKAELGAKPTPPKPLPIAPTWSAPIPRTILTLGDADVSGTYATTEAIDKFHVQLARDATFNDLVVDARLPATVTKLEAKAVPAGTYYARVSAIDADLFEGPFGEVAALRVVRVTPKTATAESPGTVDVGGGLFCALDGAPLAAIAAPMELPRGSAHLLRCAPLASGEGAAELPIDIGYAGLPPPPPPPPDKPSAPIYAVQAPPRVRPWELALFFGGARVHERLGIGSALSLEATANVRVRRFALAIGVRPVWERYGLAGDHFGHTGDVFGVGLPITARTVSYGPWSTFLAVTPQLLHDRVRANVSVAPGERVPDGLTSGNWLGLQLGAGLRFGGERPWALQLEAGYRFAPTHAIVNGDVSLAGPYAALGGRFGF